jgi:hypothetical protein
MIKAFPRPTLLLLACQLIYAQDSAPVNIVVVAGEGSLDRILERVSQPPQVRVEDKNNQPITGAAVVFTLPASGATGEFEGGGKNSTVITDEKGVAVARGIKMNDTPGKMEILVNVAYKGDTANAVVTQYSSAPNGVPHHGGHGKLILIIAAAGGGGAAAAFLASHKSGGSSSGSSPGSPGSPGGGSLPVITLTVGSSTVGAPPH